MRLRGDYLHRHLTESGVFSIYREEVGRHPWVVLYLDGRRIALASNSEAVADGLSSGVYDDLLGFGSAELSIPRELSKWNSGISTKEVD